MPVSLGERALAGAAASGSAKLGHEAAALAAAEHLVTGGKTDLLLRFFDSEFFDEWIAVSYLWRTKAEARSGLHTCLHLRNRSYTQATFAPRACATIYATACTRSTRTVWRAT